MPAVDWGYDGGRGLGVGAAGRPSPKSGWTIAVGVPQVPLFYPDAAKAEIGKIVLDNLRLALLEVAGRVSDAAGAFADTGNLAQSFANDPASATGGLEILGTDVTAGVFGRVFSSLPYAIVMEEGRRTGAPISRAGIDAIGLWAQRKLGLSADEADSAKWAIANTIMSQGIEGKHYADQGFQAAKPGIELMFQDLSRVIGAALVKNPQSGGGP